MSKSGIKRTVDRTAFGKYTVDFLHNPTPEPRFGGKGNGLLRAQSFGFRVPYTCCVTTDAFDDVLKSVEHKASSLDELVELLRTVQFPEELEREVRHILLKHPGITWAVRSSSMKEEHSKHSFAGIQHSVLHVQGVDAVCAAIREVWISLFGTAALLYRAHLDVQVVPRSMAVLMQHMLEPKCAGVLCTTNPMNQDVHEAIISVSKGLAVDAAQGQKQDTYYVEKPSGYVRSKELGTHHSLQDEDMLSAYELCMLARLAVHTEVITQCAQDIEWAFVRPSLHEDVEEEERGKHVLVLLQMRDMTGLMSTHTEESVWTNTHVGEALPGVGTPLTWSIIKRFSQVGFKRAFSSLGLSVPTEYTFVGSFRGRVYLNLTEFMHVARAIPLLSPEAWVEAGGGGGAELVQHLYEKKSSWEFLKNLPRTLPRVLLAQTSMPVIRAWWVRRFEKLCEEFFSMDLERMTQQRLSTMLAKIDELFDKNGLITLTCSSNFLMSYIILHQALKFGVGPQGVEHKRVLLSGLDVKSAQPGLAMLHLGSMARRSMRLRRILTKRDTKRDMDNTKDANDIMAMLRQESEHADVQAFLEAMDQFQADYGHRAPREAELATPRWREDSSFVFKVIRGFIESPDLASQVHIKRAHDRASAHAKKHISKSSRWPVHLGLRAILALTRHNACQREELRTLVVHSLDMYRLFFLECGRRLVRINALRTQNDVFFLNYNEIKDWLLGRVHASDFALRVLVRREVFELFSSMPDPPGTCVLRGREIVEPPHSQEDMRQTTGGERQTLHGLPGSSGRVTGRARILLDPLDLPEMKPSEVLVVPYADVGWTPLFLNTSAVVMALGGPLSHACIVAREFGIPTVVDVKHATQLIKTGDIITVDADQGIVIIHDA